MTRELVSDPTAEDYVAAARAALDEHDHPLAVEQASAAVAMAPSDPSVLAVVDDVLRSVPRPLELLTLREGAFFGLSALRGRALARVGRVGDAVDHVLRAATFSPETPLVAWALGWTEKPTQARAVAADMLGARVLALIDGAQGREVARVTANLEAALVILDRVLAAQPDKTDLAVVGSRLLRILGRGAEAEARLQRLGASWAVLVERAALAREGGDAPARIRLLEQARSLRPDDASTHLDLGDAHLDDGDLEQARAAYDRVLAKDPGSSWARASADYASRLAVHDESAPPQRTVADDPRALDLREDLSAYAEHITAPLDPLVRVVRAVSRSSSRAGVVRVRADREACPSAERAFALARPDLRWQINAPTDTLRVGNLGASKPEHCPAHVRAALSDLLAVPYSWRRWTDAAARRAVEMAGDDLCSGLGAPLALPAPNADAVLWVHAQQLAVALLVAHDTDRDRARRTLFDLLAAVDDWTSAAAALGLRVLAEREAGALAEVTERLAAFVVGECAGEVLPAAARAIAIVGCALTDGAARRPFLRLRARCRQALR